MSSKCAILTGTVTTTQVVLTRNGLQEDYFVSGANDPLRFIYASAPGRGLEQVLSVRMCVYV